MVKIEIEESNGYSTQQGGITDDVNPHYGHIMVDTYELKTMIYLLILLLCFSGIVYVSIKVCCLYSDEKLKKQVERQKDE